MKPEELQAASEPTFYFVGVTTGKSSIMKIFPRWAKHLGLGDCPILGIDCKWHDTQDVYRDVVSFIKQDAFSMGALVTTHKMDLLAAAGDLFDELGPDASLLGEISCISKRDGRLRGHAKDPISSGLSLEAFVPVGHFKGTGADVCILGAGGSSLALTLYLMRARAKDDRPKRLFVTNRSEKRLKHMQDVHTRLNSGIELQYYHCPKPEQNDEVVNCLRPHSLVANATGLGKDAPGSPLTEAVVFPEQGFAWDFNYRGDLIFLDQARTQKNRRKLHIEDGWVYFIHGWTRVIAEVFDVDIPVSGPEFDELSRIAAEAR